MKKRFISLCLVAGLLGCQSKQGDNNHGISSDNIRIEKIEKFVQTLADKDDFSGVILIAKDDKILMKKAYGLAHQGHKVANNTNTKFYLASIGKSFTAVSIFQLLEAGRIQLNDPLGKFLPNYPNKDAHSITVAQLLSHRSGLGSYSHSPEFFEASKDRFRSLNDLAPMYENRPLESGAGEEFSYRNTNFNILGRIIEVITGQRYDDYIKQHIFDPLQMQNTDNYDIDHPIENAAEGYMLSEVYPGRYQKNVHMGPVKGGPAGGGYSTLSDLFNFVQGLKQHKLLTPQTTKLYTTPPMSNWHYGYGLQFANPEKGTIYGHSGGFFGVGSEWRYFSEEDYTVILLTNRDQSQGFLAVRYFIQKLMGYSSDRIESYLFTNQMMQKLSDNGFEAALAMAKARQEEVSEMEITIAGYDLLKRGQYETAIAAFRIQTLLFPASSDAFDSLGESYMKGGNRLQAIINYKKSLELNPDNTHGAKILNKLELN